VRKNVNVWVSIECMQFVDAVLYKITKLQGALPNMPQLLA